MGEKQFPVDSLTSNRPSSIQYHTLRDKDVISFLNVHYNEIQLFDFNSESLIKKIPFDKNLFGTITGYHISSLDSIFITSNDKLRTFLVDEQANLLKTYRIENSQGSPLPIGLNTFKLDSLLLVTNQVAMFDSNGIIEESLVSVYNLHALVLGSGKDSFNFLSYPAIYKDGFSPELGLYFSAIDDQKKEIYFGFSASDFVLKYALIDGFEKQPNLLKIKPTDFFEVKNARGRDVSDFSKRQIYYLDNYNYGNLIYDKFRNLIYRLAYFPVENPKKRLEDSKEILKKRKLLVFDPGSNELKLEICLDEIEFYEGLILPTPIGILIYRNTEEEDEIKFEIYEFM
ncbi:DUF4221 family protein [Pararhodonellum marinum]|uniref:DUF4221 family protein n=1 Tax=Pararhodonellum marinum TaxID=2755358 RepID=UPI001E3C234E|nr:DUF4221 family protein [Pararhodonellum marinum]